MSIKEIEKIKKEIEDIVDDSILQSKNGMIMKLAGPKLKKDKKFVMEMLTKTKDNYVYNMHKKI